MLFRSDAFQFRTGLNIHRKSEQRKKQSDRSNEKPHLCPFDVSSQHSPVGLGVPTGEMSTSGDSRDYLAGNSHGTIGIKGIGLASGDASNTAIAPRSAPVRECVTRG